MPAVGRVKFDGLAVSPLPHDRRSGFHTLEAIDPEIAYCAVGRQFLAGGGARAGPVGALVLLAYGLQRRAQPSCPSPRIRPRRTRHEGQLDRARVGGGANRPWTATGPGLDAASEWPCSGRPMAKAEPVAAISDGPVRHRGLIDTANSPTYAGRCPPALRRVVAKK